MLCAAADSQCGAVNTIHTSFSFLGGEEFLSGDIRCHKDGDPHGCLGDLGWYQIRLSLLAFNAKSAPSELVLPRRVMARCSQWSSDGVVPFDMTARLAFGEGWHARSVTFDCSFINAFRQRCEIVTLGTRVSQTLPMIGRRQKVRAMRELMRVSANVFV